MNSYEDKNYLNANGKRWVRIDYCNRVIRSLESQILSYQQAKKAVELFEKEHVGQSQSEIWKEVIKILIDGDL